MRSQGNHEEPIKHLLPSIDVRPTVKKIVEAPKKVVETVKVVTKPVVQTTEQIVSNALAIANDRVLEALELARRTASAGTNLAMTTATTALQTTLNGVRRTLEKVLAGVGIKLPAPTATPTAQGSSPNLLEQLVKPVQGLLGGVGSLLERLLGRR